MCLCYTLLHISINNFGVHPTEAGFTSPMDHESYTKASRIVPCFVHASQMKLFPLLSLADLKEAYTITNLTFILLLFVFDGTDINNFFTIAIAINNPRFSCKIFSSVEYAVT